MPIDPGTLPNGETAVTAQLIIQCTMYICGFLGALIVAVTWKG
jgi:hypothetical protein